MSAKVSKGMYGNLCLDTVADEDDYRDGPIIAFEFSTFSVTIDRFSLIVAELSIVEPDRLPLRTI